MTPTCPAPSVPTTGVSTPMSPHPTQILPAWGRGLPPTCGQLGEAAADWTQAHSQSLLSWADPSFPPFGEEVGDRSFQFFFFLPGLFVPVWGHLPGDPEGGEQSSAAGPLQE